MEQLNHLYENSTQASPLEPLQNSYPLILDVHPFSPSDLSNNIRKSSSKFRFGRPHPTLFALHKEVTQSSGLNFDILYAAKTWGALQALWTREDDDDPPYRSTSINLELSCDLQDSKLAELAGRVPLYVHSGGLTGNDSMMERYNKLGCT